MSSFDFFEELDQDDSLNKPGRPIWTLKLGSKSRSDQQEVLKWLNGELDWLIDRSSDHSTLVRRNVALYRGIQYETQEARSDNRDRAPDRSRVPRKIVANHLFDLTQNRISRLIKFKPAVAVLPTNDEWKDQVSAKAAKNVLSHIWYNENFEGERTVEIAKIAAIMGEAYCFIEWNPDKGDEHPKSPGKGEKVSLLDEDGSPLLDEAGRPIKVEDKVYTGDVCISVEMPFNVYLQDKGNIKDVEYSFRRHTMNEDEARLRWPDAGEAIKSERGAHVFRLDRFEMERVPGTIEVWQFHHKKTKGLCDGREIWFTKNGILSDNELPYSHGKLPFVRYTDIDIPGQLRGMSFFENVKALTATYNNMTNMILRNQVLVSHPKWMMPAGSAQINQLTNDITIVQYKGPVAPQLVQANPTGAEVFEFREKLKEDFQQIGGVFGVSRGEPPKGVTAGVAIQFLNEQENERANETVLKWNEMLRQAAKMTLSVANDFYDESDERMIRVLGENDAWKAEQFNKADLDKSYDIRIQNASALASTKAGQVQQIIELNQAFPGMIPQEQVVDIVDLGSSEKFTNIVTAAVRTAEAENDKILQGEKVVGVGEHEDHISHWNVHVKKMQEYRFKEKIPKNVQQKLKDHVQAHEMLMWEQAKRNPMYLEKLATLSQYPIFFVPDLPEPAAPTAEQAAQPGAAPNLVEGDLPVNPELGGEPQLQNNTEFQPGQVPVAIPDESLVIPQSIETQQQSPEV